MKFKKKISAFYNEALVEDLSQFFLLDKTIVEILVNRGYCTKEAIKKFLNPSENDFYSPFLLHDINNCIERIRKAVKNEERVLVFGDYDVDGISATAIMCNLFEHLGLKVGHFLPNRYVDGYGISIEVCDKIIAEFNPNFIITVDCGISCKDEIAYLKSKNIDVVVTDHHEIPDELPDCPIVNAKLTNSYPFKHLCGAGVVYKIACALTDDEEFLKKCLVLASLATISDIVPLVDENRAIVTLGLKLYAKYLPLGLKLLCDNNKLNFSKLTSTDVSFKLCPKLNASGRMGEAEDSMVLFLEKDKSKLLNAIEVINQHNINRQELCNQVYDDCIKMLETKCLANEKAIILSSPNWDVGILGIIASRLVDQFNRPVFLFSQIADELKGSGRSIETLNIHDMLLSSQNLLEKFGGHSMAAGLSLKVGAFDEFKKKIYNFIDNNINDKMFASSYFYDSEITEKELTFKFFNDLTKLEPFGSENSKPVFLIDANKINITTLKNFPMHANILINKKLNLISFNYKKNAKLFSYSKDIKVAFDLQTINANNEAKGMLKHVDCSLDLDSTIKDYGEANYLLQLTNLNKQVVSATNYNYYSDDMLASFVHDLNNTIYGTLFIANKFETYKNFIKTYETANLSGNFIFEINATGGENAIIFAPESLNNFNHFSKIIFLDSILDSGYILLINKISLAEVYIPQQKEVQKSVFSRIYTDRQKVGIIFECLKQSEGKEFPSLLKLYHYCKKFNNYFFSYPMFLFCVLVFSELDILTINETNDNLIPIITQNKSKLNNSAIYNFIDFLKKVVK